jgi:PKD domain/Secretion system C-terminal sorting domain
MKSIYVLIVSCCLITSTSFAQLPCVATVTSGTATQTICLDASLPSIRFNIGDDLHSADIVTGLPQGISYTVSQIRCITTPCNQTITISGTPSASGTFPYTLKNSGGGCTTSGANGTLTVSTTGTCARNCIPNYSTTYDTVQNQFTMLLDASNNGVSYSWDFGDGSTSTSATPTHTFTKDSIYNVCLTVNTANGNSCTFCHNIGKNNAGNIYRTAAGFSLVVVDNRPPTTVATVMKDETKATLFPNPTSGKSKLVFSSIVNNVTISVTNSMGQLVVGKSNFSGTEFNINLDAQPAGMYIIEFIKNDTVSQLKLIKE